MKKDSRWIAMYLRLSVDYSTEEQESNSISNQRFLIQQYIGKDPELSVMRVVEYCDEGYTGATMDRPDMQRLLGDVKLGYVACIIVKDMSRFSRDYIVVGDYLNQIFPFMHVRFISVNDGYDSKREVEHTMPLDLSFRSLLNDLYSKDSSIKIKTSVMAKLDRGEYVYGKLPLGYRKSKVEKYKVEIDDYEAQVVRKIIDLAIADVPITEIARVLHKEKVPTCTQIRGCKPEGGKTNATWSPSYIYKILKNPFYIGDMVYAKSYRAEIGSAKVTKVPKEKRKVHHQHHEALMTMEEWNYLSKRISCAYDRTQIREKRPLTGKVICGGCGYKMRLIPDRQKERAHFRCDQRWVTDNEDCKTKIKEDILNEIIVYRLNKELQAYSELYLQQEVIVEKLQASVASVRNAIRKKIIDEKELRNKLPILFEEYTSQKIDLDTYRLERDAIEKDCVLLNKDVEAMEEKIKRLVKLIEYVKSNSINVLRYIGSTELTCELTDIFISRVTIHRGKRVEIEWAFSDLLNNIDLSQELEL